MCLFAFVIIHLVSKRENISLEEVNEGRKEKCNKNHNFTPKHWYSIRILFCNYSPKLACVLHDPCLFSLYPEIYMIYVWYMYGIFQSSSVQLLGVFLYSTKVNLCLSCMYVYVFAVMKH